MLTDTQEEVLGFLDSIKYKTQDEKITLLATYLGYEVARNPVNPSSPWKMLVHEEFDPGEQAVIAVIADDELNIETKIQDIRKRHEHVKKLRNELGTTYSVPIAVFIGEARMVLFRIDGGNRDERLDLSQDSVSRVSLYATYFVERLKKEYIRLKEDEFGFGYLVQGLEDLFTRELSTRFNHMIELYRKKFAEIIVADHDLRLSLLSLVTGDAQQLIRDSRIDEMVEDSSFKASVGCVVDTMILRQLLRRFLEAYHGQESFAVYDDLRDIGLGVAKGKLEEVLGQLVDVYHRDVDDTKLKKAVQEKRKANIQLEFTDLFSETEEAVTAEVSFKNGGKEKLPDIYDRLRRQFQLAYGGDLLAGSVAEVTNTIEDKMNTKYPGLLVKLWADIWTEQYNFRYEDLRPELLQHQYEASMSRTIQIRWDEEGSPVVFYGDDLQEQKTKGAYYTDNRFVEYMVRQSLEPVFDERVLQIVKALDLNNEEKLRSSIDCLLALKVVDITCGGGSFLRGAFYWLAENRQQVARLLQQYELGQLVISDYPMFSNSSEGQYEWERHVLTSILYGVDIDYKALIICSQTLTLSALRNWRIGTNFTQLIGLTLAHQNALITSIPFENRKEAFKPFAKDIARLINLREKMRNSTDINVRNEAEELRIGLQGIFKLKATKYLNDSGEMLHCEVLELNFPEVFFDIKGRLLAEGGFNVALGNPPWEIWKLNVEEFFEVYDIRYRKGNKQEKLKIEKELFTKHEGLQERWKALQEQYAVGSKYFLNPIFYRYQRWQVEGKFTGSDTNLYKVSLERFYQLLSSDGYASILVPGNITSDRGATGLRHLLLKETTLKELLTFENRKGIFGNVHRSYKISLLSFIKKKPNKDHNFKAFFYRQDLEDLYKEDIKLEYSLDLLERVSPGTLSFLEFRNQSELYLSEKLYKFPLLGSKESNWGFTPRKGIDFSQQSHLYNTEGLGLKVYGGKTVNMFTNKGELRFHCEEQKIESFLKTRELKEVQNVANINSDSNMFIKDSYYPTHHFYRLVYRDVSSSTNKRTLIATVVPKNVILSDSLFMVKPNNCFVYEGKYYYIKNMSESEMLLMTGLLNSFVVDYLARRKVDKHLSIFIMEQLPIPLKEEIIYKQEIIYRVAKLICIEPEYDELARIEGFSGHKDGELNMEKRQQLKNQIDAYVAQIYRVTREELIYIMNTFESPKHKEEIRSIGQGVIEAYDELLEKGELQCPI